MSRILVTGGLGYIGSHTVVELMQQGYDVVIVGGGIAGVSAAVSSSRNGAKTLLIEKQINLGGLATSGLISWYEPLCDGNGNQVIFGIAEELIRLSVKYGFENLPKKWGGEGENEIHYDRFATRYSPTVFSLALDEFVRKNGVSILPLSRLKPPPVPRKTSSSTKSTL